MIGAGAIGGFYGVRLAQAGSDVHFLFRNDAVHVREHGLKVTSPDGDHIHHPVNAHPGWETIPQVDVAIVAVKAQANADVAPLLPSILKPGGSVLLIQNGLGSEELIAEAIGPEYSLIGGLAFIQTERVGPGHVAHYALGQLSMGAFLPDYQQAPVTDAMRTIADELGKAGVDSELAEDLLEARYRKLLWNAPFNGLSVILNATTDLMINDPAVYALVGTVMQELISAAAAEGRKIDPAFVELLLEGTKLMPAYSTSMKVDYDHGRPLEIDGMIGAPLARAARFGVEMPALETIYKELQFINARLGA